MKIPLTRWELTGSYSGFWEFGRSMELNMKLNDYRLKPVGSISRLKADVSG